MKYYRTYVCDETNILHIYVRIECKLRTYVFIYLYCILFVVEERQEHYRFLRNKAYKYRAYTIFRIDQSVTSN